MFALRWAAPEVLQQLKFSSASDVWSFGVTLCEVFSEGDEPFGDDTENCEVIQIILAGMGPSPPVGCPVADTIQQCFCLAPADRPSFADLVPMLQQALRSHRAALSKPKPSAHSHDVVAARAASTPEDGNGRLPPAKAQLGAIASPPATDGYADFAIGADGYAITANAAKTGMRKNTAYGNAAVPSDDSEGSQLVSGPRPQHGHCTATARPVSFQEHDGMMQNPLASASASASVKAHLQQDTEQMTRQITVRHAGNPTLADLFDDDSDGAAFTVTRG